MGQTTSYLPTLAIGTKRTPSGSCFAHVRQSIATTASAPTSTTAVPSASSVQLASVQQKGSATCRSTIESGRGRIDGAVFCRVTDAGGGGRTVSTVRIAGAGSDATRLLLGHLAEAGRRFPPRCIGQPREGEAMPATGEKCSKTGTYEATCPRGHWQKAEMVNGFIFPPCGERAKDGTPCGAPLDWTMKPAQTH